MKITRQQWVQLTGKLHNLGYDVCFDQERNARVYTSSLGNFNKTIALYVKDSPESGNFLISRTPGSEIHNKRISKAANEARGIWEYPIAGVRELAWTKIE